MQIQCISSQSLHPIQCYLLLFRSGDRSSITHGTVDHTLRRNSSTHRVDHTWTIGLLHLNGHRLHFNGHRLHNHAWLGRHWNVAGWILYCRCGLRVVSVMFRIDNISVARPCQQVQSLQWKCCDKSTYFYS